MVKKFTNILLALAAIFGVGLMHNIVAMFELSIGSIGDLSMLYFLAINITLDILLIYIYWKYSEVKHKLHPIILIGWVWAMLIKYSFAAPSGWDEFDEGFASVIYVVYYAPLNIHSSINFMAIHPSLLPICFHKG